MPGLIQWDLLDQHKRGKLHHLISDQFLIRRDPVTLGDFLWKTKQFGSFVSGLKRKPGKSGSKTFKFREKQSGIRTDQ